MNAGDFFKRKGLLPNRGSHPSPAQTKEVSKGLVASTGIQNSLVDDAFSRPTLVPDTPPQEQAAQWELREHAPTAPAPKRAAEVTSPPPAGREVADTIDDEDRVTLSLSDVPSGGPVALLVTRANPAIHPPARDMASLSPEDSPEASERRAFVLRETVTDMPEATTSLQPDSNLGALGFVDALPRATSIPPERLTLAEATLDSTDRVSLTSLSELYALSDFSGALELAERRLAANPNDSEAQRYVQDCRRVLVKMQLSRLGSLQQVVELAVDSAHLQWLTLDHRAGFLLSLIDGLSTLEDLLDICGMPRLQALQIFGDLLEQKVVRLRPMAAF